VVASGLGLLWLGDWDPLAPDWLRQKLLLIGALLLPVEVWDVVVVNGCWACSDSWWLGVDPAEVRTDTAILV